jgi:ketosteroid isomerase-like protein
VTAVRRPPPTPEVRAGAPAPARDEALYREIVTLLEVHDQLWRKLDVAGLAGLWDAAEGFPIYVGDEYPTPVIGWQELARHWGKVGGRLHEASMRSTLLHAHRVSADIAVAVFLAEWELVAVESPERHSGQRWVTAVLRHRDDGWRIVHHAESPAYGVSGELPELNPVAST